MEKLKIGLLPLYIKMYDDLWPEMRPKIGEFPEIIKQCFVDKDIDVFCGEICRIKTEFQRTIKAFEECGVDAIVTLHLAYSPSLESAQVLADTFLPVIVLDTTRTYDFSNMQDPDEISYNHGIHGVQDLCNLLVRKKKSFIIQAGHYLESDVIDRVISDVRACVIARNMRRQRVGRVGLPFEGMGDFLLPGKILKESAGIEVVKYINENGVRIREGILEAEIIDEIKNDRERFDTKIVDKSTHRNSVISGLILRKWIQNEKLTAVTVNFMEVNRESGFYSMPFLEACKCMERGIGYAGEGDVLTAALTGALMSVYGEVSFTEMFCPDWKNNTIFLSHMGEMNLSLAAEKPVLEEVEFRYTDVENSVIPRARFKEGRAVIANLAPVQDDKLKLILTDGTMKGVDGADNMKHTTHGWFVPNIPVSKFLEKFSSAGGTHHSVLIYGNVIDELTKVAKLMDWEIIII